MRLTLIVTTYERPDALARVLQSVGEQSQVPDEIIVADDGSGEPTRELIQTFARHLPAPVQHVRQHHDGFRLARLRNLALAAASGDYLIFIDGDMVLHRDFLIDHRRAAKPKHYCQGLRIPLTPSATQAVLQGAEPPDWLQPGIEGRRRLHALRLPSWQTALSTPGRWLLAIKGCNQGFWRKDLLDINGYDERFVGWGSEDKDLCGRLERAGIRRRGLLAGALAYHLHHPPADRTRATDNRQWLQHNRATGRLRAERGVDQYVRTS